MDHSSQMLDLVTKEYEQNKDALHSKCFIFMDYIQHFLKISQEVRDLFNRNIESTQRRNIVNEMEKRNQNLERIVKIINNGINQRQSDELHENVQHINDTNFHKKFLHFYISTMSKDISDAEKFVQIREYLDKEPLGIMTDRAQNDDTNYVSIQTLVNQILEIPAPEKTLASLQQFAESIKRVVEDLKKVNLPAAMWETVLVAVLQNKLDEDTRQACDCSSERLPSLSGFLEAVETKVKQLHEQNSSSSQNLKRLKQLAEIMKHNPELWDPTKETSPSNRDTIWEYVSIKTGQSKGDAEKEWKRAVDLYRQHLKGEARYDSLAESMSYMEEIVRASDLAVSPTVPLTPVAGPSREQPPVTSSTASPRLASNTRPASEDISTPTTARPAAPVSSENNVIGQKAARISRKRVSFCPTADVSTTSRASVDAASTLATPLQNEGTPNRKIQRRNSTACSQSAAPVDFDLQVVREVRKCEALWPRNRKYNPEYVESKWKEVGRRINIPYKDCIEKWRGILRRITRYLQGKGDVKPELFEETVFVHDYCMKRASRNMKHSEKRNNNS